MQKIGEMGLIMIISGSIASVFAGCILDAVKKYKVSLFWSGLAYNLIYS